MHSVFAAAEETQYWQSECGLLSNHRRGRAFSEENDECGPFELGRGEKVAPDFSEQHSEQLPEAESADGTVKQRQPTGRTVIPKNLPQTKVFGCSANAANVSSVLASFQV